MPKPGQGTKQEYALNCPECGSPMALRSSRYGLFYGCTRYPKCKGTHGAHADGRPLGKPANQDTKKLRMAAHAKFDQLWKSGRMNRGQAYVWLRHAMSLPSEEAHIANFDKTQCETLIQMVDWELKVPGGL